MLGTAFFDGTDWREGVVELVDGRMRVRGGAADLRMPRLDGVVIGGFCDHHVHLQLVDQELLGVSRLGRVVDLGADVDVVAALVREVRSFGDHWSLSEERSDESKRPKDGSPRFDSVRSLNDPGVRSLNDREGDGHAVEIGYAGGFLTPVGGYPSDRSWAPEGSWRAIADPHAAEAAVAEMADAGATRIKLASNSTAGPVFDDDLFRAIVAAAGRRGLPVVAHAEGPGEAQRAARLGAHTLAHAPFSERLSDDEIATQAASVSWISTLSIHDDPERERAIDNVRRFHAAGGTVHYGTDMGNGPTPVDLNAAELAALREAGIDGEALLRALAPQDPRDAASVLLLLPSPDSDPASARPLTAADLKV